MLTAHISGGHTPGCTTWTMEFRDARAMRHVVFVCSPSVPSDYKLIGNPRYPNAVDDYRREFVTLGRTPESGRRSEKGYAAFISFIQQRFEAAVARRTRVRKCRVGPSGSAE